MNNQMFDNSSQELNESRRQETVKIIIYEQKTQISQSTTGDCVDNQKKKKKTGKAVIKCIYG